MKRAHRIGGGVALAGALAMFAAVAQAYTPLTIDAVGAKGDAPIDVGSLSWAQGRIPRRSSAEGRNIAPDLYWTGGPSATKSYAVIVEDADAEVEGRPVVHWVVFNVETTNLPEGGVWETPPPALRFGANAKGETAYAGPKPPAGTAHAYAAEVFCLDTMIDLPNGATRAQLVAAMQGHILGAGSASARYTQGSTY